MKHLKSYENSKYDDTLYPLKTYLIWKAKKIIMILKIDLITQYHIKFIKLYSIDKSNKIKRHNEKLVIFKDYEKIKSHILYESNSLQECINMLGIISDENKYNL